MVAYQVTGKNLPAATSLRLASAASVGMRSLLLAGKFLFIAALARYTTPATVGVYSISVAVATIFLYILGAEIHTYTARELVNSSDVNARSLHIQNHAKFLVFGFVSSVPFVWIVLFWFDIDQHLSLLAFAFVLLGELFCQEIGRYLLILSKPVAGNFLQLVRGAGWMPVAVWLISAASGVGAVNIVLWCWALGCIAATAFGLWHLREYFVVQSCFSLLWFFTAFKSARRYFLVVLLAQTQSYADRLIVQQQLGEHHVGLLAFFQSFASTAPGFVQAGVFSILMPRLLKAARDQDAVTAVTVKRQMTQAAFGVTAIISLGLWVGMPFLLNIIGRNEYAEMLAIFPWLLVGNFFLVASQIQHLQLYAYHCDRLLMWISIAIVPLGVLANIVLIRRFELAGVVAVFVGTSLLQYVVKMFAVRRVVLGMR
ncbi:MAG: hypothetical protein IPG93_00385 [Burkholderiales bacterium]|nr:hypothetical protein [Burkholderiales bacterium]